MFEDVKKNLLINHKKEDYLNGGCYVFAKEVQKAYGGEIYINRVEEHCGIMYENSLYDIVGKIKNKEDYHKIKDWEIEMCEKEYLLKKK